MKTLLALIIILHFVAPAGATVDPDPDQIGVYFDLDAEVVCTDVLVGGQIEAYVILTNMTVDEVWGIAFSLCVETSGPAGSLVSLGQTWFASFLDLGVVTDPCLDGKVIGFIEPLPTTGSAAPLVVFRYLLLAPMSVEFFLGPAPSYPVGPLPVHLDAAGNESPLGVSSGDPALPVAGVNGCNVVASESLTFGQVKGLYR